MHTKQQIKHLLSAASVHPNRHLGQHFLIDLNLMRLLLDAADIKTDDVVLEVGCGTGSLTTALTEKAGKVLAVELDRTLASIAADQIANRTNVKLFNTDILDNKNTINPKIIEELNKAKDNHTGRLLLVANLPYNIAAPVMLNFTTGPLYLDAMYVTVQKEVAHRMSARPGTNEYGIISIIISLFGSVKILRTLKPSVFWPEPKVESSMIFFIRESNKVKQIKDISLLLDIVNLFMSHRRKMLKSCAAFAKDRLGNIKDWQSIFNQCKISPMLRPEQIEPKQYLAIANVCSKQL